MDIMPNLNSWAVFVLIMQSLNVFLSIVYVGKLKSIKYHSWLEVVSGMAMLYILIKAFGIK